MKINQKKLARQLGNIDKWIANGARGVLEAVTGYGKTYVAILAIKRLQAKYPNSLIDVVLPKINLYEDWSDPIKGHIVKHQLRNVKAFVVNTYIKFERRYPTLLILDEIHNYASDEFGKVFEIAGVSKIKDKISEVPFVFGFTATLERLDGKHSIIEEYCPIIDTVSMAEAKREGYISKYKTYNLGLEFNEEDREEYDKWDDIFKNTFAKFEHKFDIAMACCLSAAVITTLTVPVKKQKRDSTGNIVLIEEMTQCSWNSKGWCMYVANKNEWDGQQEHPWSPMNVSKYAQQFSKSMRERKLMIYRASVKIDAIEEIVNKFMVKTITFGEDSSFADKVVERLGSNRCKSYHSKTLGITIRQENLDKKGRLEYKNKKIGKDKYKRMILDEFQDPTSFQVLSTVRSLDEGLDNPNIKIGVQASYNSSRRQNTQRTGRATRKDEDDDTKVALNINLYIKETKEEAWLKDKQRGIEDVEWVDSVEEITLEESQEDNFSLT
jgi:superfamily II DNA or RNA helicase